MKTKTTEVSPNVFVTTTTDSAGELVSVEFHGSDTAGKLRAYQSLVAFLPSLGEAPPELRRVN